MKENKHSLDERIEEKRQIFDGVKTVRAIPASILSTCLAYGMFHPTQTYELIREYSDYFLKLLA